ncbi:MAG: DNA gyrase subunit A [Gammaproteobacteria bacterium]|nr:DNA gyrase subunit A [Gammaproteobacteria bacterium]MDH3768525.1 DNA gyrase subunit A [Gammaproteobacteria bacterium]
MTEAAREILQVNLEDEMRQSYLDYAMSVIVGRALPDVRDGLKPVHRRILFSMQENNNAWNRPYVKCARVVGDVLGKYHPHGDGATYDALVRMAQDFSMRYPMIDGQGNFGSIDGDPPAAYRYTECRMTRLASELLADIDKETVDFVPNYDDKETEPTVLPTRVPSLLVNGSSGIAVGMATNIPPHNLREVINATLAVLDNSAISLAELMQHIPGPDFPTAAIINGARGIVEAYKTGRGRIYVRARTEIETKENGRETIVVKELPYQVNKARLLEKIAELVREKRLGGISDLRDESDKDGMRMVIELKRGEVTDVVLNNLYKQTMMQSVFGINMVALSHGQPRVLNLKEVLDSFLQHRREIVTRRTIYDLRKARERAHVLEGLAVALTNIDSVIALIKKARTPADARVELVAQSWPPGIVTDMLKRAGPELTRPEDASPDLGLSGDVYRLSEVQAQAILELRLHRLTGLEQDKLLKEYKDIIVKIEDLNEVLDNRDRLTTVIRAELEDVRDNYADDRRTEIVEDQSDLTIEDLITEEDVVVTLSHAGYAKAQPPDTYQAQRRGGRGKAATRVKDEDFVDKLFVANTHDTLLCFSTRGKLYWLKVYQVPQAGRGARGRPIINLLPLEAGERITAVLPIRDYEPDRFVIMSTSNGTVKKTELQAFSRPRSNGIIAIALRDDDELVDVSITDGNQHIMLLASNGKAIRFREGDVRPMGRNAAGVRGIRLSEKDRVIALIVVEPDAEEGEILTATANGFGKRTAVSEFPSHGRGGQGVIAMQTTERNGVMVGANRVSDDDEVMLISAAGTLVRTEVSGISIMGRNTQGVRLIRVQDNDALVGLERIAGLNAEDDLAAGSNDNES